MNVTTKLFLCEADSPISVCPSRAMAIRTQRQSAQRAEALAKAGIAGLLWKYGDDSKARSSHTHYFREREAVIIRCLLLSMFF